MKELKIDMGKLLQVVRSWRKRIALIFVPIVVGIFVYWIWIYKEDIAITLRQVGPFQLITMLFILAFTGVISVYTLVILLQDKGYSFRFSDGYHSLNLSQLASLIPGGIWGYAGFAGMLWSKGVTRLDSMIIIFVYTLVMLSACVIVGFLGLITAVGWKYAVIFLLPFLFLAFGRNWMDRIRQKYYPDSSPLPSRFALLKALILGIVVWIVTSACFAWLIYSSDGAKTVPFWTIIGAYSTGYLGGYIAILAPSGLGVSEGLMALILGPYIGVDRALTVSITFRIIHTIIIWLNILLSIILTSGDAWVRQA